jgi:hypothetical protein
MLTLSAPHSEFVKRVLPFAVAVGAWGWVCWPRRNDGAESLIIALVLLVALILIVLGTLRKGFWRMADTVEDRGDRLVVRRWKTTIEIPLTHVQEVLRVPTLAGSEVIVVLHAPCELGSEISFLASSNRKQPGIDDALESLSRRVASQGTRDVA